MPKGTQTQYGRFLISEDCEVLISTLNSRNLEWLTFKEIEGIYYAMRAQQELIEGSES